MFLRCLTFLLLLLPGMLHATEEHIVLEDDSTVKVFLFYPKTAGEGPWPLTVLMSGGVANEYTGESRLGDRRARSAGRERLLRRER